MKLNQQIQYYTYYLPLTTQDMVPFRHIQLLETLCSTLEHTRYTLSASATLATPVQPPAPDPHPTSYPYPD
jgi:hypothetical protein